MDDFCNEYDQYGTGGMIKPNIMPKDILSNNSGEYVMDKGRCARQRGY